MNEEKNMLGSTEAAVYSCVSLISSVTGQREEVMAYWLDLYYQVRTQYEREKKPAEETITKKELSAMLRDMMQQSLQGETPAGRTSKKAEKKAAPPQKKPSTPRDSAYKREVAARLDEAKKRGITVAQIAQASEGSLTEGTVLAILERKILPPEVYRELDIALARLDA